MSLQDSAAYGSMRNGRPLGMHVALARGICGGLGAARVLELAFIDRCVAQESRQSAVMISDHFQHERADVVSTLK